MVTVGHGKRGSQSTEEDRNGRQQILEGLGKKMIQDQPDGRTGGRLEVVREIFF